MTTSLDRSCNEFMDIRLRLLQGKATERDYIMIFECADNFLKAPTVSKTLKKIVRQVKTIITGVRLDENSVSELVEWEKKLNNKSPVSLDDRVLILQLANGVLDNKALKEHTKQLALRIVRLVQSTTPVFLIDT